MTLLEDTLYFALGLCRPLGIAIGDCPLSQCRPPRAVPSRLSPLGVVTGDFPLSEGRVILPKRRCRREAAVVTRAYRQGRQP